MRARRSLVLVATILMMTGPPVGARAQSGYEPAPTLKASDIAPPILLKGARFRVADKVPVKGLLGNFTIQSDFGKLEAHGLEMLRIRVTEVGALDTLENRTTGRFSPRAKKEFAALGWGVHEVAPITPPAVKLPTTSR
jgi:hypothetical protein